MDVDFLNLLKSIASAEKTHNLQTDSYDPATLELKYPENVITVASPTGKRPPRAPGEMRLRTLSEAVEAATLRATHGGGKCCSIVVYEGIYIDPWNISTQLIDGLSLEIVGVKNVRLVLEKIIGIGIAASHLTLKNILIFDRRQNRRLPTFGLLDGSHVEFVNVKINAPRALVFKLIEKCRLSLTESVMNECCEAVLSEDSDVQLKDTSICSLSTNVVNANLITLIRSTFKAKNSSLSYGSSAVSVTFCNSKGTFEDCQLTLAHRSPENHNAIILGMSLYNASSVLLMKTAIHNFSFAVLTSSFESKLIADRCLIINCVVGFAFNFNSHGLIKNCQLRTQHVAYLTNNVRGTVNLQNNRMIDGNLPNILKDTKSNQPLHDFRSVNTFVREDNEPGAPSDKEQSAKTKKVHDLLLAAEAQGDRYYALEPGSDLGKCCHRCRYGQLPNGKKMKFCVKCRIVCYCSKQCQLADWEDHQLVCR